MPKVSRPRTTRPEGFWRVAAGRLPDPCDSDLLVLYIDVCHRAGVEPLSPQRVRELVDRWNCTLRREPGADYDQPKQSNPQA